MNKDNIKKLLKEYDSKHVDSFINYIELTASFSKQNWKTKQWENPNAWLLKQSDLKLVSYFEQVNKAGLEFDDKHVTIQKTGVTFDYVAYKNKMLIAYPETSISLGIVYEGDTFSFQEDDGKVTWSHKHKDPFNKRDDNIIGAFSVIKNKRGEFLTALGKDDIAKHRSVAKTDSIWRSWFPEMVKKTVMKKACKYHFDDIVQYMEEVDNESYDLELPLNANPTLKDRVNECETMEELTAFFKEQNPKGDDIKLFTLRRKALEDGNS